MALGKWSNPIPNSEGMDTFYRSVGKTFNLSVEMNDELIERLKQLERAGRPLEPGGARRRKLRDAIIAASERFLRPIRNQKAYQETPDRGAGILSQPIEKQ